jgi:FMN phosphatase YigB (HAD superfamily)
MKGMGTTRLLVCDLDNTLYDWVGYFVPSFYTMVDEVIRITNCDRDRLLDDFRAVHRAHHDSEHPFALLETNTIRELFPDSPRPDIAKRLDSAFHAFNTSRKDNLRLYPGVRMALDVLSKSGVVLVAHTESKLYAVVDRLNRLGIAGHFQRIYCRERSNSQHPDPGVARTWLEKFPMEKVVELSHHQRKPEPDVLLEICRDQGVLAAETAYVGDSVARDMLMAKAAGVFAIWAKYGVTQRQDVYERLVRVSHWTAEDVARERELRERARSVEPDYVLEGGFADILNVFRIPKGHSVANG